MRVPHIRLMACGAVVFAAVAAASAALAQDRFLGLAFRRNTPEAFKERNTAYDGRFTFIRLRYSTSLGGMFFNNGGPGWSHDYPTAEVNLMAILKELTLLTVREDGSNILTMDDPDLFNFPLAYLSEPGGWRPNEAEAAGLRNYLLKGGFLIIDDFAGPRDWNNMVVEMARVLPEHRFIEMTGEEPVWHSFFEIPDPGAMIPPYGERPEFHGIFEDNDPNKRLIAVANYNNDIGDFWEWSGTGLWPIDLSNEAYKVGVNYVVYGMTH